METPLLTLTHRDDGRAVALRVDILFALVLDESPTTGYRWEPPAGVEVVADEYRTAGGTASGAGGERVLTIAAPATSGEAQFALTRPWGGGAPDRTFTLSLTVHD